VRASVSRGMFGGELPWTMVGIGAAIGAVIIIVDEILKSRNARFRTPVLAAAVGIYLPLELTVPIFLGGLLTWIVEKVTRTPDDEEAKEKVHRPGVLFSAGLITGEALMGIVMAIPIVVSGNPDILALPAAVQTGDWGEIIGLGFLAVIAWLLFRTVRREAAASS
jgi:putative OPT family oligopeptide transporter